MMLGRRLDQKIKDALMKNKIEASREVGVPKTFDDKTNKFPAKFTPSKDIVNSLKNELEKNKIETSSDQSLSASGYNASKGISTFTPEIEKYSIDNLNRIW